MKTSHTLEQRQAIGIEEIILAGKNETGSPLNGVGPKSHTPQERPQNRHSGASKAYACKQCGYSSTSKEEKWAHARTHKENQLACEQCAFVTRYKHHLQYHHISTHSRLKPFTCIKCNYACSSKSALNSHMKYSCKFTNVNCICFLDLTSLPIHTDAKTAHIIQSTVTASKCT